MSKQLWMIVAIALIVGFFAFIAGAMVTGISLSPTGAGDKRINAHECTADGDCEVNVVKGPKGIFSLLLQAENAEIQNLQIGDSDTKTNSSIPPEGGSIQVENSLFLGDSLKIGQGGDSALLSISDGYFVIESTDNLLLSAQQEVYLASESGSVILESLVDGYNDAIFLSTLGIKRLQISSSGDINLPGLAGNGTDYICVTSQGTLFRSNTAC